jgi:Ser/Thr protein kinase RdoA (MazF antagonist)
MAVSMSAVRDALPSSPEVVASSLLPTSPEQRMPMLSRADAEIVRRESALPGLEILLDPDALADALAEALPAAGVRYARVDYLRYKPGTSCLAGGFVDTMAGRVRLYFRAHRRDALDKLGKARMRMRRESVLGPLRFVLQNRAIGVHVFPDDRRVRGLARLFEPDRRERLVAEVLPERPDVREAAVQTLRYKPERRYVGRLVADRGPDAAVLRVYAADGYESAKTNAQAFRSHAPLSLARLLGSSDDRRVLALEWRPGRLLRGVVAEETVDGDLARVGEALARFHAQTAEISNHGRIPDHRSLVDAAAAVAWTCPHLARPAQELAESLLHEIGAPFQSASIHGDLHCGQILLDDDGVSLLDLDRAAIGEPAADFGSFFADLDDSVELGLLESHRMSAIECAVTEGYRRGGGLLNDARRIAIFRAAALLLIAPHPFRRREPSWPERTESLLRRALELLDQGARPKAIRALPDPQPDPAIPPLSRALDARQVEPALARLPSIAPPGSRVRVIAVRAVRHKPGRRALLEYDLEIDRTDGRVERTTLLAKVRAKGVDEMTYRLVSSLWRSGFHERSRDRVSVPEPLGAVPELGLWLQRKVAGTSADRLLGRPDSGALARRIADALKKLHRHGPLPTRRHDIDDELEILRERLAAVSRSRLAWGARIGRLLEVCEMLALALRGAPAAGIHRDFYPDQVIVDGERLWLLDFDLYCAGDPALDAGNFMAHLTEQGIRNPDDADALERAASAFEERFAELSGERTRRRARAHAVLSLARHVSLSLEIPGRAAFAGKVLELCEAEAERVVAARRRVAVGGA